MQIFNIHFVIESVQCNMLRKYIFVLLSVRSYLEISGYDTDPVIQCNKVDEKICEITAYDPDLPIISNDLPAENVMEIRMNGTANGSVKLTSNVCNAFPNLLVFKALGMGLKEVEADAFKNCSKLTAIYLDDNMISSLDNSTFQTNHELERLELPNNSLKTFDTSILNNTPKLELIFLSDNGMEEFIINDTSVQLKNLRKIELKNNKLNSVDLREIKNKFPNIRVLVMCNHEIDSQTIKADVPDDQRFLSVDFDCDK